MTAALIEAARDLAEAVESMQATFGCIQGNTPEDDDLHIHEKWAEAFLAERLAPLRTALAAAEAQPALSGWDGTEDWEALAWHLCAEENGEDACNELVWEGGPMPEPWGDRWLKYEGPAKDMIAKVRKFAPQPAAQPLTDAQINAIVHRFDRDADACSDEPHEAMALMRRVCRAIERAHGIGSQP